MNEPEGGGHEEPRAFAADGRRCTRCGYDLTALEPGGVCPECGTPPLVLVYVARSSFDAQAVLAVLRNEDIDAVAAEEGSDALRAAPAAVPREGVPILVSSEDHERARKAIAASSEIDWEQVDVGERADEVPLRRAGRMPPAARVAWLVGIALLALTLIAVIAVIVL